MQLIGGGTDHQWAVQRAPIEDATFADGGRAAVHLGAELDDDLYGLFTPESVARLGDRRLYFDAQHPEFVPIPTDDDLGDADEDALGDLSAAAPADLVGKTNAALWSQYGLAVGGEPVPEGAGRRSDVLGGYVEGATDERAGVVDSVATVTGSLVEYGEIGQGERVYVYDDAESTPGWLTDWTDTGNSIGTTDGPRQLYRKQVAAGRTVLGGTPDTNRMYSVLLAPR